MCIRDRNGTYSLSLDQWENTAVLCAGDGRSVPYEYRLTVYVDEVCRLSVSVEPEEGVFAIYDEDKIQLEPVDGVYELILSLIHISKRQSGRRKPERKGGKGFRFFLFPCGGNKIGGTKRYETK